MRSQIRHSSAPICFSICVVIKTHGSELRSQETTKRTSELKRAVTTVSYLRVGTILQYYP